jgi:S-adenosylmethionine:tRNA ribosyltransferase-isomerase
VSTLTPAALTPAAWPDRDVSATRLLHVDPARGAFADRTIDALATLLRAGDLLVLNDAATLPASLRGSSSHGEIELRLCGAPRDADGGRWLAVLFGAGSWRDRTEERPSPPRVGAGATIELEPPGSGRGLAARVVSVSPVSPRLVELRFDRTGAPLWSALFRLGRAVQYAHTRAPLPLWHVQTAFAGRPVAAEMPSAGRPLRLPLLRALRAAGVAVSAVTHAAGLSSTGDPALDAALPLPEPSWIPEATVAAIERARKAGGRVVAVGTSVVRALEGAARDAPLRAGASVRGERIGPDHVPHVVEGVLSGVHAPGESHFELLQAFAPRALLERALAHASEAGYLGHEFGDATLILRPYSRGASR